MGKKQQKGNAKGKKERGVVWGFLFFFFLGSSLRVVHFRRCFFHFKSKFAWKKSCWTILPLLPSFLLHGLLLIYEGKQPFLTTEIIPKKISVRPHYLTMALQQMTSTMLHLTGVNSSLGPRDIIFQDMCCQQIPVPLLTARKMT